MGDFLMGKYKDLDKNKVNNNKDPYGYDFVQTLAHITNIDEQRETVNRLENINKKSKKHE